jgi:hypothetical protein
LAFELTFFLSGFNEFQTIPFDSVVAQWVVRQPKDPKLRVVSSAKGIPVEESHLPLAEKLAFKLTFFLSGFFSIQNKII